MLARRDCRRHFTAAVRSDARFVVFLRAASVTRGAADIRRCVYLRAAEARSVS